MLRKSLALANWALLMSRQLGAVAELSALTAAMRQMCSHCTLYSSGNSLSGAAYSFPSKGIEEGKQTPTRETPSRSQEGGSTGRLPLCCPCCAAETCAGCCSDTGSGAFGYSSGNRNKENSFYCHCRDSCVHHKSAWGSGSPVSPPQQSWDTANSRLPPSDEKNTGVKLPLLNGHRQAAFTTSHSFLTYSASSSLVVRRPGTHCTCCCTNCGNEHNICPLSLHIVYCYLNFSPHPSSLLQSERISAMPFGHICVSPSESSKLMAYLRASVP